MPPPISEDDFERRWMILLDGVKSFADYRGPLALESLVLVLQNRQCCQLVLSRASPSWCSYFIAVYNLRDVARGVGDEGFLLFASKYSAAIWSLSSRLKHRNEQCLLRAFLLGVRSGVLSAEEF
jgi:hypothetical protein